MPHWITCIHFGGKTTWRLRKRCGGNTERHLANTTFGYLRDSPFAPSDVIMYHVTWLGQSRCSKYGESKMADLCQQTSMELLYFKV